MPLPTPPWWIRLLTNGKPREYAIGAICFTAGVYVGKDWKNLSRSGDRHWKQEHNWHDGHNDNHHGKYTEREHERREEKKYHGRS